MARSESSSALRRELERAIQNGKCAYCRRPGSPENPLTREHAIPRAKGGGRKDVRIIVPACARCNHRRGCRDLVLFLLLRPRRISAFLDYLSSLSPESVRQLDLRVLAELYAAIWMLSESADHGPAWRSHLRRMCSGRTLHRRRYAARRLVGAVGARPEGRVERSVGVMEGREPTPAAAPEPHPETVQELNARMLALLALAWQLPADEVRTRMAAHHPRRLATVEIEADEGVVPLDGWRRRHRRRLRVDRRGGRRHPPRRARGRAA